MKNILLVLPFLFIVTGPLNGMELKDLERKEAEISIVGDDSFVTKRKYGYTSQYNVEVLEFRGGWLSWSELNNGIYYTSGTNPSSSVVRRFNSSKFFAKFVSGSAKKSDVKFKNDSRFGYYWISQEGERLSCLWSTGEWGVGALSVSGNNRITVSMCKPGKKKLVEDFLHDLMARVQIDGGVINKMKESGKYNEMGTETKKELPKPNDFGRILSVKTPNNISKLINEYPYFKDREKAIDSIRNASQYPMTVSVAPPHCPAYNYTAYRGFDPDRSLRKCNDYVKRKLINYNSSHISRCKCKIAIKNMIVIKEDLLMQNKKWTVMKLFHKDNNGMVTSERGFFEYEKSGLVDQNIKLLNKNLKTVCESDVKFSILGKNKFKLSCFGGNLQLFGNIWLANKFSRDQHIVGSGTFDDGSGIAFISTLSDAKIEEIHPEFFKNVSNK